MRNVDPRSLDSPENLRRRTDRRSRMVIVAGCVLAAMAVVVPVLVGRSFLASSATLIGSTPSPPASSASRSAVNVTPPLPIPDAAFLSLPADMKGSDPSHPQDVEGLDWLPRLCNAAFPTVHSIEQRTRMSYYNEHQIDANQVPTGTVHHLISVSDQAVSYLAGLRSLISDGCTTELGATPGQTTQRFRVLPASTRGDDSLLIEMRWSTTNDQCCPPQPDFTHYLSVTRIGTVLSVILVDGWEGDSADRQTAELFTDQAVAAVQDWIH